MERFWSKVDQSAGPDGCWLWLACKDALGYGRFGYQDKTVMAYRMAYMLEHGLETLGHIVIRHLCDNPSCVNPDHLVSGTQADNVRDRVERERGYRPQGEKNVKAKVSAEVVEKIRAQYYRGRARGWGKPTQKELAQMYGLSQPQISKIVLRQSWGESNP